MDDKLEQKNIKAGAELAYYIQRVQSSSENMLESFQCLQKILDEKIAETIDGDLQYMVLNEYLSNVVDFQFSIEEIKEKNERFFKDLSEADIKGMKKNSTMMTIKDFTKNLASLRSDQSIVFRPVGNPLEVNRVSCDNPITGRWVGVIVKDINKFSGLSKEIQSKVVKTTKRYFVNAIVQNVKDNYSNASGHFNSSGLKIVKKLKILELPQTAYRELKDAEQLKGVTAGDWNNGLELKMTRTGSGMQTRYAVKFISSGPLGKKEREIIKKQGLFELEKSIPLVEDEKKLRKKLGI